MKRLFLPFFVSLSLAQAASLRPLKDPDISCLNMRALRPLPGAGAGPALIVRLYNIQPTQAWVTLQVDNQAESQAYLAAHTRGPVEPGSGVPSPGEAEIFSFDHPRELFAFKVYVIASGSSLMGSVHLESGRSIELNGEQRLLCNRGQARPPSFPRP